MNVEHQAAFKYFETQGLIASYNVKAQEKGSINSKKKAVLIATGSQDAEHIAKSAQFYVLGQNACNDSAAAPAPSPMVYSAAALGATVQASVVPPMEPATAIASSSNTAKAKK